MDENDKLRPSQGPGDRRPRLQRQPDGWLLSPEFPRTADAILRFDGLDFDVPEIEEREGWTEVVLRLKQRPPASPRARKGLGADVVILRPLRTSGEVKLPFQES